jgi:hypothetical protein
MAILESFVLAAAIAGGDYVTTRDALARGGRELSPFKNQPLRAGVQAAAIVGADQLISRRAPRLKWYWRAGLVVGMGAVMAHNLRTGR